MSIKKNIAVSYVSQVVQLFLSFASSILIARILGAELRGSYALYTNGIGMAAAWLGFSLPSAMVYFVANKKITISRLFWNMVLVNIILSVLVVFLLLVFQYFGILHVILPENNKDLIWIFIFSFHFLLTLINGIVTATLSATKRFVGLSKLNTACSVISVLLLVLYYFNFFSLPIERFIFCISLLLLALFLINIVGVYHLFKNEIQSFNYEWLSKNEWFEIIQFSLLAWLCNAFAFLNYRFDIWVVDSYHGKAEVGVYSLAVSLAQLIWILPSAVSAVIYTYIAEADLEKAKQYLQQVSGLVITVTAIVALTSLVFLYYLIPVFFGIEFSEAFQYILILFLGYVPYSFAMIMSNFNAGNNLLKLNLYQAVAACVLTFTLVFLLVPSKGALGACYATSASYFFITICSLFIYKYYYGMSFNSMFDFKQWITLMKTLSLKNKL